MKQTLMALRATGVLLAIWTILAGIALAAGVLPPFGDVTEVAESGDADADADANGDGNADGNGSADGNADGNADEGEEADGNGNGNGDGNADEGEEVPVPPTYAICTADIAHISLAALEVVGDARPEIAVGCGPRAHIYAFAHGELEPVRVATLDAAGQGTASATQPLFAGPVAGMDVDGDGLGDLVVPFRGIAESGDTRGGALFLIRRDAMGAFETPIALAPIAASSVVLAQLDGQPGAEILATNRGSDLARRMSEVWIFTGGPLPTRAEVLRPGVGDVAVAVADLDRDGQEDVIMTTTSADRVQIHFGDGTARFPRTADVPISGATELLAGDVDGDGGEDILIRGTGLSLLAAGPAESLSPRPIEAPAAMHALTLRDIDGDRKRDIVGIDGQRLVWLRQGDGLTFSEETLISIEGAALQHYALADLDGDGTTDLVAVGRAPEPGAPWSLTIVPDVREALTVVFAAEDASAPASAPLTLRVALRGSP